MSYKKVNVSVMSRKKEMGYDISSFEELGVFFMSYLPSVGDTLSLSGVSYIVESIEHKAVITEEKNEKFMDLSPHMLLKKGRVPVI